MLKTTIKKLGVTGAIIISLLPNIAHLASIDISAPAPYQNLSFKQAPGTKVQIGIDIKNSGTAPTLLTIYTTDGSETATGGFAAKSKHSESKEVGLWTSVSDVKLKIASQKTVSTKLTVDIPKYVAAGQYKGALVMEEDATATNKSPYRIAIPINVEVTGNMINHLDATTPTYKKTDDGVSFHTTLTNSGNTSLKVSAILHVAEFGFLNNAVVDQKDLNLSKGQKADLVLNWDKNPFLGFFKATMEIKYYQDMPFEKNLRLIDTYTYDLPVTFCNITLTVIFGVILLITAILFYNKPKHAKKKRK